MLGVVGAAKFWLDSIPARVQIDPKRRAEVRAYKKLAKVFDDQFKVFDDQFHVFYSTPWLRTDEYGYENDGE